MAIYYQNNAGFKISTDGTTFVDLTDHVTTLTINRAFDELDVTAMGQTGHSFIAGLEASSITVDFLNDTATASVLQTLNTLVGTNAKFKIMQTTVPGSPATGTASATNPLYTGLVLVNKLTPIAGQIGSVAVQTLSFTVSGAITVASSGTF